MFPKCEDPQFYIKGGDGAFANRQKSIFDQLDAAEKEQTAARNPINTESAPRENDMEVEPFNAAVRTSRRNRCEMRQFRGKESIFKRPDAMPPRFKAKAIPDHHKNPHKWVKYSLGDISQADMSNHSNTAAAFSFLQEIAARKASAAMDEADVDSSAPISFRKPRTRPQLTLASVVVGTESRQTVVDDKPSFKSSKLVMPEYVVGMSKRKQRKRDVQTAASTDVNLNEDEIPFSFPSVDSQQTTSQTSDDTKQMGDGEKQVTTKNKQKKQKKELQSKTTSRTSEIPLGHLMDYVDDEG